MIGAEASEYQDSYDCYYEHDSCFDFAGHYRSKSPKLSFSFAATFFGAAAFFFSLKSQRARSARRAWTMRIMPGSSGPENVSGSRLKRSSRDVGEAWVRGDSIIVLLFERSLQEQ